MKILKYLWVYFLNVFQFKTIAGKFAHLQLDSKMIVRGQSNGGTEEINLLNNDVYFGAIVSGTGKSLLLTISKATLHEIFSVWLLRYFCCYY